MDETRSKDGTATEGQNSLKKGCQSELQEKQKWPNDVLEAIGTHVTLLGQASRNTALVRPRLSQGLAENSSAPSSNISKCPSVGKGKETLVDVNSDEAPLPNGWEQFLDIRTGRLYFIDWNCCKQSIIDPRSCVQLANDNLPLLEIQTGVGWDAKSQITQVEDSICVAGTKLSLMKTKLSLMKTEEMEVESKYTGNISPTKDDSGICELITDDESSKLNCRQQPKMELGVVGCQNCLRYFMQHKERQLCWSCGGAINVIEGL